MEWLLNWNYWWVICSLGWSSLFSKLITYPKFLSSSLAIDILLVASSSDFCVKKYHLNVNSKKLTMRFSNNQEKIDSLQVNASEPARLYFIINLVCLRLPLRFKCDGIINSFSFFDSEWICNHHHSPSLWIRMKKFPLFLLAGSNGANSHQILNCMLIQGCIHWFYINCRYIVLHRYCCGKNNHSFHTSS